MKDVLILVTVKEEDLSVDNKLEDYKKALCEKMRKLLNNNDISNEILEVQSNIDLNSNVKCFINIEVNSNGSHRKGVEIFSPKVTNKSHDFANILEERLGDIGNINYNTVEFIGNNLPYNVAKIYLQVCLSDDLEKTNVLLEEISKKISLSIGEYLGVNINSDNKVKLIKVINSAVINKNKAKQFSENIGLNEKLTELIDYYWELCKEHGDVDPLLAYAQAIVNINEKKIDYNYFNPGGIKDSKLNSSGLYDYKRFTSLKEGITAQLDHLALFGGAEGYPRVNSVDPRHFKYLFGSGKTLDELSGKWDNDKNYGEKILKIYNEIYNLEKFQEFKEPTTSLLSMESRIDKFLDRLIAMGTLLENLFKEYSVLYKELEGIRKDIIELNEEKRETEIQKEELEKKIIKQKNVIKDILNVIGGSLEKK
ncbi:hypothetical protein [Clostridium sp.]|uniref:hypothetical protein n=1 Tax=Clostridium sp. TaxID=1506 RepID=UPI003995673E